MQFVLLSNLSLGRYVRDAAFFGGDAVSALLRQSGGSEGKARTLTRTVRCWDRGEGLGAFGKHSVRGRVLGRGWPNLPHHPISSGKATRLNVAVLS